MVGALGTERCGLSATRLLTLPRRRPHRAWSALVAGGLAEVKPVVLPDAREVRVIEGVVPDDLIPPFAQGRNFAWLGERLLGDRFVVTQHGVRRKDDLVAVIANPQTEVRVVMRDPEVDVVQETDLVEDRPPEHGAREGHR